MRGIDFDYAQPGIQGNLANNSKRNKRMTIESLLMKPPKQPGGSVLESPVLKVVRDTPDLINNKYYVYGHSEHENQLFRFINIIKPQIEKWIGKTGISITAFPRGLCATKTTTGTIVAEEALDW